MLGRIVLISLILSLQFGFAANQGPSVWESRHFYADIPPRECQVDLVLPPPLSSPPVNSGQNGPILMEGEKRILAELWAAFLSPAPPPEFCLLNVSLESGKENKTKDKMRRTECSNTSLFSSHRWKSTTKPVWQKSSCRLERMHWIHSTLLTASQDDASLLSQSQQ